MNSIDLTSSHVFSRNNRPQVISFCKSSRCYFHKVERLLHLIQLSLSHTPNNLDFVRDIFVKIQNLTKLSYYIFSMYLSPRSISFRRQLHFSFIFVIAPCFRNSISFFWLKFNPFHSHKNFPYNLDFSSKVASGNERKFLFFINLLDDLQVINVVVN